MIRELRFTEIRYPERRALARRFNKEQNKALAKTYK